MIDWANFTPYTSLAGGLLIGLAAALLILLNGRIAGISGILGSIIQPAVRQKGWRIVFVIGLISAPLVYQWGAPLPEITNPASTFLLVIGGLLVGIGTGQAAGCTSGHGVCGLARGSVRSLVATLSFMIAGIVTVYIVHHVIHR